MQCLIKYFSNRVSQTERINFLWNKCVTAGGDLILLSAALINFIHKHKFGLWLENGSIGSPYLDDALFFTEFYAFLVIFSLCLFMIIFSKGFYILLFALVSTLFAGAFLGYAIDDFLTVKTYIFSSWILAISCRFSLKQTIPILFFGCLYFLLVQFHPEFIIGLRLPEYLNSPNFSETVSLIIVVVVVSIFSIVYHVAILNWQEKENIVQHIDMSMTQMSQFNQQLQEFAKKTGEEAAEQERLRITRDMHDSLGYVFVNIIGLMEAAKSSRQDDWDKIYDTYDVVLNLAKQGLQETRRTLHAIRDIRHPLAKNTEALMEIKNLFENVTGIQVELKTSNIKNDYGHAINSILFRTMQEALTNSVRHGMASKVFISLWDDEKELRMVVRDNGIGSKQVVKGIGLMGMEERLSKIGGTLETGTPKDGGFSLTLYIPLIILT